MHIDSSDYINLLLYVSEKNCQTTHFGLKPLYYIVTVVGLN